MREGGLNMQMFNDFSKTHSKTIDRFTKTAPYSLVKSLKHFVEYIKKDSLSNFVSNAERYNSTHQVKNPVIKTQIQESGMYEITLDIQGLRNGTVRIMLNHSIIATHFIHRPINDIASNNKETFQIVTSNLQLNKGLYTLQIHIDLNNDQCTNRFSSNSIEMKKLAFLKQKSISPTQTSPYNLF